LKELTKRILVALWGIPLLLILSYLGGYYFFILILIINGVTLFEYYSVYNNKQVFPYKWLGIALGSLVLIFVFYELYTEMFFVILAGFIFILLSQLKNQTGNSTYNMAMTFSGLGYISGFLSTLLYLRLHFGEYFSEISQSNEFLGGKFLIILWVSIWICDTAAYFGGSLLGKHKLAPVISPNKTVEGGVFGLIFGVITFALLGLFLMPEISIKYFWISGFVVGIFGQLGDLIESRFKRDAGVKDTSTILPGHGGFLDRFDSIIFISPFLFLLFHLLKF
jgi:phosphatidate cytidylyltransferase